MPSPRKPRPKKETLPMAEDVRVSLARVDERTAMMVQAIERIEASTRETSAAIQALALSHERTATVAAEAQTTARRLTWWLIGTLAALLLVAAKAWTGRP